MTASRNRLDWAVSAALIGALIVNGALYLLHRQAEASQQARAQVLRKVTTDVPDVLSYEFTSLPTFRARARIVATGGFREEITGLIDGTIKTSAKRDQIVTRASVPDAAVVASSADKVTLLVFVDQITHTKGQKEPRSNGSRVRVTYIQVDGHWKIVRFEPI